MYGRHFKAGLVVMAAAAISTTARIAAGMAAAAADGAGSEVDTKCFLLFFYLVPVPLCIVCF
jgi:hypothetical protein